MKFKSLHEAKRRVQSTAVVAPMASAALPFAQAESNRSEDVTAAARTIATHNSGDDVSGDGNEEEEAIYYNAVSMQEYLQSVSRQLERRQQSQEFQVTDMT